MVQRLPSDVRVAVECDVEAGMQYLVTVLQYLVTRLVVGFVADVGVGDVRAPYQWRRACVTYVGAAVVQQVGWVDVG